MKKTIAAIIVVLTLGIVIINCNNPKPKPPVGSADTSATTKCPAPAAGYAPFPSGYNFPLDSTVIDHWVANNQMDSIRMHAWNLWAGIYSNAPSGKPIWQTWYPVSTTMEITAGGGAASALLTFKTDNIAKIHMLGKTSAAFDPCTTIPNYPDTPHNDVGFLADNGDIMIAGEYFNYEAFCHIRSNGLYSASKLLSLMKDSGTAPGGQIPQFPSGSIVLKHMYWPVKQDGFSALPVWDFNPRCGNEYYNGYETWKRLVAIDPNSNSTQKTAFVNYLHIPGYPTITASANVVPMNNFYYWKIDAATWAALVPNDRRIIDNSFMWAYGRHFKPGDYLVTIAMHIITKEIYNWAMQSLWWHDIDTGYYAANKPANLQPGTWQHYLVTTAYNMVTPKEPNDSPLVAYNPYIELVIPEKNRIVSNCQNCHARAAYPSSGNVFDPIGVNPTPINFPGPDSARYNSSQRGLIQPTDLIFKGLVTTDFSWVITDRAH